MFCLYLMSDKRATYAIGAVLVGLALVFGLMTAVPSTTNTVYLNTMGIEGHAEVVLKDADGNIKAYQQSDNVVVLNGQDCAADLLFGAVGTGTELCGTTAEQFRFIAIGEGTATATDVNTILEAELSTLTRTGTLTESAAATTAGDGTGAMKTIVGTFTLVAPTTVAEVGLFDDVANDAPEMFSRIILGTPIGAGTGDTITITYKITVG